MEKQGMAAGLRDREGGGLEEVDVVTGKQEESMCNWTAWNPD